MRAADSRANLPLQMVALTFIVRSVLFCTVWLSLKALPPDWSSSGSQFVHSWSMWDGGHYAGIATDGYRGESAVQDRAAFFPLYPLLMRAGSEVSGLSVQFVGMGISFVSLLATIWLFTDYVRQKFTDITSRLAATFMIVAPYAVFLTAVYTESLFMLLAISSLRFADRRSWMKATVLAGLATATRISGLALVPAILWLAWRNREPIAKLITLAAVSCTGIIAYMAYCWMKMGNPLALFAAQEDWGGWYELFGQFIEVYLTRPGEVFSGEELNAIALFNLLLLVISIACVPAMWKKLDKGMAIYSTLILVQGAVSLISFGRMMIPAFGVYIVFALWLEGEGWKVTFRQGALFASLMVMTIMATLFAQGKWVI